VKNYNDAQKCNTKQFARYFKGMLKKGIYLAPSQFEAMFIGYTHTHEDVDRTLQAAESVFLEMKQEGIL
ncbi:MAG: aspartate aminotransferase family protein, partial [Oscillospiraceae bacterium]